MMRRLYIFGLVGLIAIFIGPAWAAEMTLTTYYPAPFGVYKEFKTTGTTLLATDGGKVGIGTKDEIPGAELEVRASTTYIRNGQIIIDPGVHASPEGGTNVANWIRSEYRFNTSWDLGLGGTAYAGGTPKVMIKANGRLGIGTISPGYSLDVNGTINATNVLINGAAISGGDPSYGSSASSPDDAVYVNDSGKVGIGTTAPGSALDLNGALSMRGMSTPAVAPANQGRIYFDSGEDKLKVSEDGAAYAVLGGGGGLWTQSGDDIYYNDGKVGIGTTAPAAELEVAGNVILGAHNGSDTYYFNRYSAATPATAEMPVPVAILRAGDKDRNTGVSFRFQTRTTIGCNTNVLEMTRTGGVAICYNNFYTGTHKLYINGNAYATGYWLSSDIRWKSNIETLPNPLDKVLRLRPVSYDWNIEEFPDQGFPEGRQIGIIAQELEQEFPELVSTDADGYKAAAYGRFTAVLLEAIKAQQKDIEALKAEVQNLKGKCPL